MKYSIKGSQYDGYHIYRKTNGDGEDQELGLHKAKDELNRLDQVVEELRNELGEVTIAYEAVSEVLEDQKMVMQQRPGVLLIRPDQKEDALKLLAAANKILGEV